jgi:hypothetical protein
MPQIRLTLDPWPAEYESSFEIDGFDEEDQVKVDTDVEGVASPAKSRPRVYMRHGVGLTRAA